MKVVKFNNTELSQFGEGYTGLAMFKQLVLGANQDNRPVTLAFTRTAPELPWFAHTVRNPTAKVKFSSFKNKTEIVGGDRKRCKTRKRRKTQNKINSRKKYKTHKRSKSHKRRSYRR